MVLLWDSALVLCVCVCVRACMHACVGVYVCMGGACVRCMGSLSPPFHLIIDLLKQQLTIPRLRLGRLHPECSTLTQTLAVSLQSKTMRPFMGHGERPLAVLMLLP